MLKFIDHRPLIRGSRLLTADEIEFLYPINSTQVRHLNRTGKLKHYKIGDMVKPFFYRENDLIVYLTTKPEEDRPLPEVAEVISSYLGTHVTMALILCPFCANTHLHPMEDQLVPAGCDPDLHYYVMGSETLYARQQATIDQGRVYLYQKRRDAVQATSRERNYEVQLSSEGHGSADLQG